MECPKCHSENNDASRFCSNCAAPLAVDARMADSLTKTLATPLPVIAKDKLIAGKYRIIEEIGHGGMGIVYKAEDLQLQRCVALKFLPPHLMDSPELRERFLIEARAAAALSHPNICVIHEVGESEERPYIAMEYVEGETLRDRIRKGPLKPEETLRRYQSGRGRAGRGPRQGHHPSGHQERQHHGDGQRPGQGHGLRAGQAPGREFSDQEPDDAGHGGLHVPGTSAG